MEFGLTKEQELVKQMVKNFALNEVKPIGKNFTFVQAKSHTKPAVFFGL